MIKDYCPGCYDLTTGGVFGPKEDVTENAVRELEEETGLTVEDPHDYCELMEYGWLKYVDPFSKVWASLFLYRTTQEKVDRELKLQEEEVKSVEFWTKQEVIDRIAK